MKIASLRKVPKIDRAAELASIAGVFLPTYSDEKPERQLSAQILSDVERAFKISTKVNLFANPEEARNPIVSKIQSTLFNEIRDSVLPSNTIKSVRERLGQKGILTPSLYDISFDPSWNYSCGAANLSKAAVETCIKNADEVQNLKTLSESHLDVDHFSLFLKRHPVLENCSILVLTLRNLARLVIKGAWHVFHKIIGSDSSERPLKLLERLANKYGLFFYFGEEKTKFVFDRSLVVPININHEFFIKSREKFDAIASVYQSGPNVVRYVLVFTLTVDQYMADMTSMGLKGTVKTRPI